jgi:membrane protease YdiL (CAAX protease family)
VAADSRAIDATGSDDYRPATWRIWGLGFDARVVQLVCVSTLVLLLSFYRSSFEFGTFSVPREYSRFVLELLIPMAIVLLVWRESPRRYGWQLGTWQLGLPITLAAIAVMAVVILLIGRQPDFVDYYAPLVDGRPAWRLVVDSGIELLAWEFLFRGWLLWGLGRKYGPDAIWLQIVPFALMHILKPEFEALSTIAGGLAFGMLAWKTRSFLWGWLIHWFMVAFLMVVVAGLV